MNRTWVLLAVALCPLAAHAQSNSSGTSRSNNPPPYQPVVPAPSVNTYGDAWAGYSGASTAAGSALNGLSSVISAQGDYNLATSAAAVNMSQAERTEIQNRQMATNTYWEMRNAWRAQRDARRGPPPTMEQVARLAHYGAPKGLTPSEFDAVSGKLYWPAVFQQDSFAAQREQVDQLFEKWAQYGALDFSEQTRVREAINGMYDELNAEINNIPPQAWGECRRFLRSVIYAATRSDLQG